MARPGLTLTRVESELGGPLGTGDGISVLVTNVPTAYTFSETKFLSLKNAEDAGITQQNDLTYNFLLWEHIKDFYSMCKGVELHIFRVPPTTTMTNLFTFGNVVCTAFRNYLAENNNLLKMAGISIMPATESHTTSISADLLTAIPLAQDFAVFEAEKLRPIDIFFEGRKFSGTVASAQNLRALASGKVSVVVARDQSRVEELLNGLGFTAPTYYAAIGLLLGTLAGIHVGRNIGRIESGTLPIRDASFSDGRKPYVDFSDDELDAINDKGYIYFDTKIGAAGWYWQDDPTCALENRTDAYISLNRPANKIDRILLATYVRYLKDDFNIDITTGRLPTLTIKTIENVLENAVRVEMIDNPDVTRPREISGISVKIPPNQSLLASGGVLLAQSQAVPLAIARTLSIESRLINPSN